jgi:acyl transferase domain-containing protein
MNDSPTSAALDAIAIVGMSGRFPGAPDVEQFWQNLKNGSESITFFTDEELQTAAIDTAQLKNPNYVKAKALLDDAEMFDAAFFDFTPREAMMMDPQHRVFLESAWHALENAGYAPRSTNCPVGVFAGTNIDTYLMENVNTREMRSASALELRLSTDNGFLATRVAYKLGLKGPAITIQTACSTSLVAVCQACQSLVTYQCDMALAGAATVKVPRVEGYLYQDSGITSPDGHCRAFDAQARGTVPGEGVAVVVLKRLEDAIADNDSIYALIKGWAVNNDGDDKVGYTAPSVNGQAEVVAMAQSLADVDAATISYVEAHGTGTELGDPIEIAALTEAFSLSTDNKGYCAIGSVKTNVGHLDATAGITGLIKTVLSMQHRQLPPHLYFHSPNPKIDFANSPFYVNTGLTDWDTGAVPLRAGVSSFGMGGTNSHVVLEQAPDLPPTGSGRCEQLLLFSARTADQLGHVLQDFSTWLLQHPAVALADAAYTLKIGRKRFKHTAMLVCQDSESAAASLACADKAGVVTGQMQTSDRPVVFMFPGQGNQYTSMGHELYLHEPDFKNTVDQCCEYLNSVLDVDLLELLYPAEDLSKADKERINETRYAQPALFVIEYALASLLVKWGVQPQALIGHSIGEYVAACIAGVLSLSDALLLVANRAALMQSADRGAMTAVPMSAQKLEQHLTDKLSLAVINEPGMCVVSGTAETITLLESSLDRKGIKYTRLHTSHAFHSSMMDPVLPLYREFLDGIRLSPPQIPYISNITGTWITAQQATDPDYWVSHLRNTVHFSAGVAELLNVPGRILLEVGPGTSLAGITNRHPDRESGHLIVSSMRHPRDDKRDMSCLLDALGKLWMSGIDIDWDSFYANEQRRRIALPAYPFEKQPYWIHPDQRGYQTQAIETPFRLKKNPDISSWSYVPTWTRHPETTPKQAVPINRFHDHWLLFIDDKKLERQLTEKLRELGAKFETVSSGSEFSRKSDSSFTVRTGCPDDYRSLFSILIEESRLPANILYAYPLESPAHNHSEAGVDHDLDVCFYGPMYIAQALGHTGHSNEIKLVIATEGMQFVTGTEAIDPYKAVVLGPSLVIPREFPRIKCHTVDFDGAGRGQSVYRDYSERIIGEFEQSSEQIQVAYRGNYRWSRDTEQFPIQPAQKPSQRLRAHGTYLITGGLGGIGLTLAEYLARTVSARLILVGRTRLPEPANWDKWLEDHPETDPISQKIRQVRKIESYGVDVACESADVTSFEQMRSIVDRIVKRYGSIHGVVHAAGLPTGGMIQLKTQADAAAVIAPKVHGAFVLDRIFENHQLDFMMLCSSLVTEKGAVGQVDYTAANAFLDAFAQHRMFSGKYTVAVDWDAWSEVGMALNMDVADELATQKHQNLSSGISCEEGADVFSRILHYDIPQFIISTRSTFDRSEYLELDPTAESDDLSHVAVADDDPLRHERPPSLKHEYVPPRNELETTVAAIWQELFGIGAIGVHDSFFELGGHSLLGVQIISRLNSGLDLKLTINEFFEAPSIAQLCELIENLASEDIDDMVDQMSDEEVSRMLAEKGIGL